MYTFLIPTSIFLTKRNFKKRLMKKKRRRMKSGGRSASVATKHPNEIDPEASAAAAGVEDTSNNLNDEGVVDPCNESSSEDEDEVVTSSLGTNSPMFMNCSVFCDVRYVRSSVLGQNVMFGSVQSLVLLLCDQTSLGTYSLMFTNCCFFVMFDMFEVQFWAKM